MTLGGLGGWGEGVKEKKKNFRETLRSTLSTVASSNVIINMSDCSQALAALAGSTVVLCNLVFAF